MTIINTGDNTNNPINEIRISNMRLKKVEYMDK